LALLSPAAASAQGENRTLEITKVGPDSVFAEEVYTYTIAVTNRGPGVSRQVVVVDSLPANLTIIAVSSGGVVSGQVVTWPAIPVVNPGDLVQKTVTVRAPAGPTTVVNVGSVAAVAGGQDRRRRSVVSTFVRAAPLATDLQVVKSGPAQVGSEEVFQYSITATNLGPRPATNVVVQDELPNQGRFISASNQGRRVGNRVVWPTIPTLAVGASVTYTLQFQAPSGPIELRNVGTVSSETPDIDSGNNRSLVPTQVVPEISDVAISKSGPASVAAGETFDYTIVVTNPSATPAVNVRVVDDLPPVGQFVSASGGGIERGGVVRWPTIPVLNPGESRTFTVTFTAPQSGKFVNTAVVEADNDSDPSNNSSAVETEIPPPTGADLELVKTALDPEVGLSQNSTFLITVRNLGPDAATDVVVTDTLPPPSRVFFQSAAPAATLSPDSTVLTWPTIPTLGVGEVREFRVTLNLATQGVHVDKAGVTASSPDPDSTNNADTASARTSVDPDVQESLSIEKEASRLDAEVGDQVQYRLTINSVGVPVVEVTDDLPVGFIYRPGSTRIDGVSANDPTIAPPGTLTFPPIGPGLHVITYWVTIGPQALNGDGINRVRVSGGGLVSDDEARVRVRGLFSDEGTILGKVFVDCVCDPNGDPDSPELDLGQNEDEPGIPGVRVFLQDGTSAVTDSEGKYTFERLAPRTWVVRVDPSTLPPGARLMPLTNRHGNDGQSAFVDLKRGELHRADFADGSDDAGLRREVDRRRRSGPVVASIPTTIDDVRFDPVAVYAPLLPERLLTDRNSLLPPAPGVLDVPLGGGLRPVHDRAGAPVSSPDIEVIAPDRGHRSDGGTIVPLRLRLPNTSGSAVVTFETSAGELMAVDEDTVQPGLQVRVSGGSAEVGLRAPDVPGTARVRATLDPQRATTLDVAFAPALTPLMAIGLLEARIDFRSLTSEEFVAGGTRDRFEDRLMGLEWDNDEGDLFGGARAAAFLQGEVGDGYALTVRVDSEERENAEFFRDIQPDAFYTTYGDASLTHYGAHSTGRFYGQLRRGASSLTYGDFTTGESRFGALGARALGAYNRTLNGIRQHFENGRVSFDAFASRDRTTQVVDELQARGVSGPYALSRADGRINSERVELVTRDRNQPGVILGTEVLERFTDYTIEPFTGRLIFRRPVPSVDAELNPVSIRVAYEVESGADDFWVFGGFGSVRPTDRLELGGGFTRDDAPGNRFDLATFNGTLDLGRSTYLVGEFARTEVNGGSSAIASTTGEGVRVELQHASERFAARAFFLETDRKFSNPSTAFRPGRREAGVRGTARLGERTQLFSEVLRTEDLVSGGRRDGGLLALDRAFGEWIRGRVGFRFSEETGPAPIPGGTGSSDAVNALGVRLTAGLPFLPRGSVFSEFEQDVSDSDQRRLALGGDFQLHQRARLYGRHEFISSLSGPYGLNGDVERNTSVIGISSDFSRGPSVFTEYRARDAFEGRDAQAAIGLRNQWTVAEGVHFNTSLERVSPLGSGDEAATAVTGALAFTGDSLWKATARAEYYMTEGADNLFGSLGYARKLSRDWSLLGSTIFNTMLDGERAFERSRLGVAYRNTDTNRWSALARYEHRYDRNQDFEAVETTRRAHVFAGHANFQPDAGLILRAQWASKFASQEVGGLEASENAHLAGARATLDVTRRLDLGGIARRLWSSEASMSQFGLGLEIGLLVADNLRLAGGYNAFGFRDEELSVGEYTDKGFYLHLGFKFDETLFGRGEPDRGLPEARD